MDSKKAYRELFGDKPRIDPQKNVTLKVQRRDINHAVPRDPSACAIAQRLVRKDGVLSARVGAEVVLVEYRDRVERYVLSPEDRRKVNAFDHANYFQPTTIELRPYTRVRFKSGTKSRKGQGQRRERSVYNAPSLRHLMVERH